MAGGPITNVHARTSTKSLQPATPPLPPLPPPLQMRQKVANVLAAVLRMSDGEEVFVVVGWRREVVTRGVTSAAAAV